jgi:hypothetical protein
LPALERGFGLRGFAGWPVRQHALHATKSVAQAT